MFGYKLTRDQKGIIDYLSNELDEDPNHVVQFFVENGLSLILMIRKSHDDEILSIIKDKESTILSHPKLIRLSQLLDKIYALANKTP